MRRFILILIISIFGALLAGYFLGRVGLNQLRSENLRLQQELAEDEVALFYVKAEETRFVLQPVLRKVKLEGNPYQAILMALFEGSGESSELFFSFPKGSAVLGVEVAGGQAVVNLNQRSTEINVGSEGEWLAIASIVNTLTKLPEIYEVKFLIEGKPAETLAGHVDLTRTFRYDPQAVITMND